MFSLPGLMVPGHDGVQAGKPWGQPDLLRRSWQEERSQAQLSLWRLVRQTLHQVRCYISLSSGLEINRESQWSIQRLSCWATNYSPGRWSRTPCSAPSLAGDLWWGNGRWSRIRCSAQFLRQENAASALSSPILSSEASARDRSSRTVCSVFESSETTRTSRLTFSRLGRRTRSLSVDLRTQGEQFSWFTFRNKFWMDLKLNTNLANCMLFF